MKEKFTITKDDQKYMDSIGKNLHKTSKVKRSKPVSDSTSIKAKALHAKVGQGKSHISGKVYNHD